MRTRYESRKPEQNDLDAIRESANRIFPDAPELKDWYNGYSEQHKTRLAFDLAYLQEEFPNTSSTKILELGSTPLILTSAIQERGYTIIGVDMLPNRFKSSIKNNNLDIVQAELGNGDLPFPDDSFDALILNEVFEHLQSNLIIVFNELKRVLKPGGKLFLSTPNLKSVVGIRNFLFRGKAYSCCGELYEEHKKFIKYGHMGHVREYSPIEVITFLYKMGFKTETLIYRGRYLRKYQIIDYLAPKLKPFFSLISVNQ